MKYLFLICLLVIQTVNLLSQSAEINGKLNTGELLTGNYSGGFSFGTSYLWTTTNAAAGTDNLKEVGDVQTYRLKDADAGKYIRVAITVTSFWGRKETYYSDRKGPVRYSAPVITGTVTISGTLKTGNTITANYVYDPNNYPESGSTFRWYIADNSTGTNAILVSSSGSSFQLLDNQESKYIRVEITPRDANGATGANYSSSWYGPIEKTQQVNLAPVATNVRISGNPVYCSVLTGLYDYNDTELDPEGGSSFRWLRGAASGGSPTPIPGATTKTYTVTTADKGMYLYFEVTPKASSGTTNGVPVLSNPTSLIQGDLPTVTFAGNASICEGSSTTITLTFTGNPPFNLDYTNGDRNFNLSTSNYTYQLSVNAGGTYKGTRLTDILNCPVTNLPSSAVINMKASPSPDFSIGNACYTGDSTTFVNTSNPKSSITKWIWNFGDAAAPAAQNTSALEAPKHKYPASGIYSVWLAAENTEGCRDTIYKNIVLGAKPGIDLSWDKECFSSGITVNFANAITNTEKISKYSWILLSSGKTLRESPTPNLNYVFSIAGSFDVKLKLTTEAGCTDSSSKVFTLKPQIKLADSSYTENFEGGNKNWFVELKSNNNWTWGTPKGTAINSAHSGTGALYTAFPEARQNRQLSISSQCF
ncbi:MAG TPA: PKD domain-containing protein, partial [Bacteroidales bacterium]|nr:PKD domain-containing protein [Bacteroidales bacterium]